MGVHLSLITYCMLVSTKLVRVHSPTCYSRHHVGFYLNSLIESAEVKNYKFKVYVAIGIVFTCSLLTHKLSFGQQVVPTVDELVRKLRPPTRGIQLNDKSANTASSIDRPRADSEELRHATVKPGKIDPPSQQQASVSSSMPSTSTSTAKITESAATTSIHREYSESRITFEFGSDRLTPYARRVLDIFGTAIRTPELNKAQFVIEGHTDGLGSDQYNLELSRKRAEAVIRYLVDSAQIDPGRLSAKGKGRRELLNPANPGSAENRRVVWVSQQ